jgi:hypothetical protein
MAGQGYDIVMWDESPLWIHSGSGLWADFYDLIDQNPDTNRDDYHIHILEAWEHNGGLYIFPLSFEFQYVGINANLPQEYIDRFSRHDSITYHELLRIYLDLQREYGEEFGHMVPGSDALLQLLQNAPHTVMGSFIDFENKTSYLNGDGFISYLEDLKQVSDISPDRVYWTGLWWDHGHQRQIPEQTEHCVFLYSRWWSYPMQALYETQTPHFVHTIPIAGEDGRLIIDQYTYTAGTVYGKDWDSLPHDSRRESYAFAPSPIVPGLIRPSPAWGSVTVGAGGDSALAWEFTQHLMDAIMDFSSIHRFQRDLRCCCTITYITFNPRNLVTPIERSRFRPYMEDFFERAFRFNFSMQLFYGVSHDIDDLPEIYEQGIAGMERFNSMPVRLMPYLPGTLYEEPLRDFMLGLIPAHHAAQEIHNRVSLWLVE